MVRRTNQQEDSPRFLRQRNRSEAGHRRIHGCLEREAKTICLDCHRGFHRGKALRLPTDSRTDSAWLYFAAISQSQEMKRPVIYFIGHYTRWNPPLCSPTKGSSGAAAAQETANSSREFPQQQRLTSCCHCSSVPFVRR